jgi:hypothetical protein
MTSDSWRTDAFGGAKVSIPLDNGLSIKHIENQIYVNFMEVYGPLVQTFLPY